MPNVTVKHRFIHQAPRKLRLVGSMVRGLPIDRAIAELGALSQVASTTVQKILKSAIAAAKEQGMNPANLFVETVMVDEGPKMKRFIPQSKGRSSRILKRMSHVTVSVTDAVPTIASSKVYKREVAVSKPAPVKAAKKAAVAEPVQPVVEQPAVSETAEGSK
jgi:large subunit ribosomal protein L22